MRSTIILVMIFSSCFFQGLLAFNLYRSKLTYAITRTWDCRRICHDPIKILLTWKPHDEFITAVFKGPFFDDPAAPDGPAGQPFPGLWNFEVAEIFFLNSESGQYLEVEVSPHGQHLILLLNGSASNLLEYKLPMKYSATIDNYAKTWRGVAHIPLSYFPKGVNKMNAYAIHGSGENRVFEALYPVPTGKFEKPNFHRLDYFRHFDITRILDDTSLIGTYWERFDKKEHH